MKKWRAAAFFAPLFMMASGSVGGGFCLHGGHIYPWARWCHWILSVRSTTFKTTAPPKIGGAIESRSSAKGPSLYVPYAIEIDLVWIDQVRHCMTPWLVHKLDQEHGLHPNYIIKMQLCIRSLYTWSIPFCCAIALCRGMRWHRVSTPPTTERHWSPKWQRALWMPRLRPLNWCVYWVGSGKIKCAAAGCVSFCIVPWKYNSCTFSVLWTTTFVCTM